MGPHTVNAADEGAVPGEGSILADSFYAYTSQLLKPLQASCTEVVVVQGDVLQ